MTKEHSRYALHYEFNRGKNEMESVKSINTYIREFGMESANSFKH